MTVIPPDGIGNIEFSIVLHSLIKTHNQLPKGDDVKKKLKESSYRVLRKWSDLKTPMLISKKAYELIKKQDKKLIDRFVADNGLPILYYKDRLFCGRDEKGRSNLVYEHTTPISQFFKDLCKTKSVEEVVVALENFSGVCWITRQEDDILNKKYRRKRPNGWRACYKECGILVKSFNH